MYVYIFIYNDNFTLHTYTHTNTSVDLEREREVWAPIEGDVNLSHEGSLDVNLNSKDQLVSVSLVRGSLYRGRGSVR
jgi:hypothetical protein